MMTKYRPVGAIIDRSRAEIGDDPSTCSQILQHVASMASRVDTLADEVSLRNRAMVAEFATVLANIAARPSLDRQIVHPLPLPCRPSSGTISNSNHSNNNTTNWCW